MDEPQFADPRARQIGKRIRARRQQLELTQAQLSVLSGIAQGHISSIERGDRLPTLPTLMKLRDALGLPPDELAEWLETVA